MMSVSLSDASSEAENSTKIVCRPGCARARWEFTALPQISYVHFGEGEGGGEGKEGDEGEGDGREGKGRPRKG